MKVIEVDHITKDYGNQKGYLTYLFLLIKGKLSGFSDQMVQAKRLPYAS